MKINRLKILLVTLPMVLTGCGNVNANSNTIKIKFWHTFGQTIVDGLNAKIKNFTAAIKEHDNVDVTVELSYQGGYDEIAKKISDGYAVGNKPTIAVAYPDNVADYLTVGATSGEDFVVNLETSCRLSVRLQA